MPSFNTNFGRHFLIGQTMYLHQFIMKTKTIQFFSQQLLRSNQIINLRSTNLNRKWRSTLKSKRKKSWCKRPRKDLDFLGKHFSLLIFILSTRNEMIGRVGMLYQVHWGPWANLKMRPLFQLLRTFYCDERAFESLFLSVDHYIFVLYI